MLNSAKGLAGFSVIAADDVYVGHVHELIVDHMWSVRYLFVDASQWMTGRSVLLSTDAVDTVDSIERRILVRLTRDEILNSPWVEAAANSAPLPIAAGYGAP